MARLLQISFLALACVSHVATANPTCLSLCEASSLTGAGDCETPERGCAAAANPSCFWPGPGVCDTSILGSPSETYGGACLALPPGGSCVPGTPPDPATPAPQPGPQDCSAIEAELEALKAVCDPSEATPPPTCEPVSPEDVCEDDPDFRYRSNNKKTCGWIYFKEPTLGLCATNDDVRASCPYACQACP
mmetsp:Transcript_21044/g.64738  ORF Transcript_21044/g.64738 Transcript_21044/m.64738 type:complete len:190 (+) Transcript_21044:176-745(+)